ncbi:MAG: hypothetical protein ACLQJR_23280 [Stellaceae bacterium]
MTMTVGITSSSPATSLTVGRSVSGPVVVCQVGYVPEVDALRGIAMSPGAEDLAALFLLHRA